uniref:Uncharacterized protein n=1 Tax=Plectus sambesii TaxID=2011161 RepID=A0A914VCE1_9BILA
KTPLDSGINWDSVGERTDGWSGDDLHRLARELAFHQFREFKRLGGSGAAGMDRKRSSLTQTDFNAVLAALGPAVGKEELRRYEHFATAATD